MKKLLLLTFLTCFLSGCYYDSKTKCFYGPLKVTCNVKYRKDFDAYQKEGVTEEQKISDIKACFGDSSEITEDLKKIDRFETLRKKYPYINAKIDVYRCMTNQKGYIYDKVIRDY